MSNNASQTRESTDRQRAVNGRERPPSATVPARGRTYRGADGEWPGATGQEAGSSDPPEPQVTPVPEAGGELATYYRLRCIALEVAVDRLGDELDRERRRLDEVVTRYESILQKRGAEGTVTDSRR